MNEVMERPQATTSYPAMYKMDSDTIEKVRAVESELMKHPQMKLNTLHVIHAGMYSRTVIVPAGHAIVGVLIKVPTQVIVTGTARVLVRDEFLELYGCNVLPAQAGRKQIFIAITDIYITMIFPSEAQTVAEAEAEFTDETDLLMSHKDESLNLFVKTEE